MSNIFMHTDLHWQLWRATDTPDSYEFWPRSYKYKWFFIWKGLLKQGNLLVDTSALRIWAIIPFKLTDLLCNTAIIAFLLSTWHAGLDPDILAEVLLFFYLHFIILTILLSCIHIITSRVRSNQRVYLKGVRTWYCYLYTAFS